LRKNNRGLYFFRGYDIMDFYMGDYVRINITGVDIIFQDNLYNIIKDNQLLLSVESKELAVGLSLNKEYIDKMVLQGSNIYYLKVA
jgi:hypothetical protein